MQTLESEVTQLLTARVPAQRRVSVVHGDFRVDNCILAAQDLGLVVAVVDWELSTIGDPTADVAMMAAYRHPAFDLIVEAPSAWASARLPIPDALAAAYEAVAGHSLADWPFHLALAHYKVAVIAAGIAHRARRGSGGGAGFDTAAAAVAPYLEAALACLLRSGPVRNQ